ncbi:MAG: hypothetical protein QOE38_1564, partial [Thermoleophilaceae bacterium]|nr:hypothetical protein [Thermoleophilaceae bacterium]
MRSRRRLIAALAAAAVGVLIVVLVASGGDGPAKHGSAPAAADPPHTTTDSLPPLKPHPRVVIAAAPGQLPPGAQFADATTEGQQVQPPSDAEVRRELRQLQSA